MPDLLKHAQKSSGALSHVNARVTTSDDYSVITTDLYGGVLNEEARLRRAQRLAELRQEQTEKAEKEAHWKDESIIQFEKKLLDQLTYFNNNESGSACAIPLFGTGHSQYRAKPTFECTGKGVIKFLVIVIAWWDLIMVLVTLFELQAFDIAVESILREGIYNCPDGIEYAYRLQFATKKLKRILFVTITTAIIQSSFTKAARVIYGSHSVACLLLLYSLSRQDAFLMIAWLCSKCCIIVFFAFRHIFNSRLQENRIQTKTGNVYWMVGLLILYCIQITIITLAFFTYTKPHVERRRKMQTCRPLNQYIYIKSLSSFMQRKHAVRWAEILRTVVMLQKREERDKHNRKKKESQKPDEDLATEVEQGVKAFKKAYEFKEEERAEQI